MPATHVHAGSHVCAPHSAATRLGFSTEQTGGQRGRSYYHRCVAGALSFLMPLVVGHVVRRGASASEILRSLFESCGDHESWRVCRTRKSGRFLLRCSASLRSLGKGRHVADTETADDVAKAPEALASLLPAPTDDDPLASSRAREETQQAAEVIGLSFSQVSRARSGKVAPSMACRRERERRSGRRASVTTGPGISEGSLRALSSEARGTHREGHKIGTQMSDTLDESRAPE
jgi:hypothetical protein